MSSHAHANDFEGLFCEINLRKNRWLVFAGYNCAEKNIGVFLDKLGLVLDHYIPKYNNRLLIGDFNSEIHETRMSEFCDVFDLRNLITEPACFKNPENPSSIDFILTNKHRSFQNSSVIETGLSDHQKLAPVVIKYRHFKNYNAAAFHVELYYALRLIKHTDINYGLFESTFMDILNKRAPLKEKLIRANNGPFMSRELSKAFRARSRLRNKFLKNRSSDNKILYKKQRNFCVNLLRKAKRDYYKNLDIKHITDNKKFWKTVRPLFSEKHNISRNITLVEDDKILSNYSEVAKTMNEFFSSTVTNLDIKGTHI